MSETTSLPYMSSSLLTVTKSTASGMVTVAFGAGGNTFTQSVSQSSLVAWFKADAITGVSSGSSLSSWLNSSTAVDVPLASAASAAAFSAASQPLWRSTGLNGAASVEYNNGQVLATSAYTALAQPFTYFVVSSLSAVGSVARNAVGNAPFIGQIAAGSQWAGALGAFLDSLVSTSANSAKLFALIVSGSSSSLYLGYSTTSTGNIGAGSNNGIAIGGRSDNSSYWVGQIGEVLMYARALPSSEVSSVQAYLTTKYGT